jgi:acetyl esterase/lipase
LASTAATHFEPADAARPDALDRPSSRPDVAILIYPVITLTRPLCHEGSCENLLGPDAPLELRQQLSSHLQVTAGTPPCFFVHSTDDKAVPVENSAMMADALTRHHIPNQVVTYDHGGHGYGLGGNDPVLCQWPAVCATWLRAQKFCR